MKQNRFLKEKAIALHYGKGKHILWSMFEQCDNLGLSLQSYLGSISRNPRHAEPRPKAGARARKPSGDVSVFVSYDSQ